MSIKDRAAGAVMGALIGDALGVGPHWYYDLDEMRRDYGDWITGYTEPKPHRYHAGLKAGQLSQAGIIPTMLLRSTVEKGGYDEDDFCRRLDEELFPQLDGTPMNGPGGYTSQSIREAWRRRVEQKKVVERNRRPRRYHRSCRARARAGGALCRNSGKSSGDGQRELPSDAVR